MWAFVTPLLALYLASSSSALGTDMKDVMFPAAKDDSYYTTWAPPGTTNPAPPSPCDSEYSCVNATAVRICAPSANGKSLVELTRFSCPSSAPWCRFDTGTCTADAQPVLSNFTCMRNGYFPDPNNCSLYYSCQNEVAFQYTCGGSTPYYAAQLQRCYYYSYYCANYGRTCSGYSGVKIAMYNGPNNMFIYCENNKAETIDRCIGAYQFSEQNQMCVQYCPGGGLYPSDDDCANYYRCSPSSGSSYSYTITNLTCPQGQGFLPSAYECVDRSQVPNCQVPYPGLFNKK